MHLLPPPKINKGIFIWVFQTLPIYDKIVMKVNKNKAHTHTHTIIRNKSFKHNLFLVHCSREANSTTDPYTCPATRTETHPTSSPGNQHSEAPQSPSSTSDLKLDLQGWPHHRQCFCDATGWRACHLLWPIRQVKRLAAEDPVFLLPSLFLSFLKKEFFSQRQLISCSLFLLAPPWHSLGWWRPHDVFSRSAGETLKGFTLLDTHSGSWQRSVENVHLFWCLATIAHYFLWPFDFWWFVSKCSYKDFPRFV